MNNLNLNDNVISENLRVSSEDSISETDMVNSHNNDSNSYQVVSLANDDDNSVDYLSVGSSVSSTNDDNDKGITNSGSNNDNSKGIIDKSGMSITSNDLAMIYGDGSAFSATVKYDNGTPAAGVKVEFKIGGESKSYYRTTNDKGVASIAINRNIGTYTMISSIQSDDKTIKAESTIDIRANSTSVKTENMAMDYGSGKQFTATVVNSINKPVSGVKVGFRIGGESKTYYRTTDANGVASIAINRNVGTYTMYTYLGNVKKATNTITINKPSGPTDKLSITANDVTVMYTDKGSFSATVKHSNGAPASGVKVGFKWGDSSQTQYATTNSNGVASIAINKEPGTYTIVASVSDGSVSKTVKVIDNRLNIQASDITITYGSGSSFSATVKYGNGTPASGIKVGFKIKNEAKTYYRTTDANGVASIAINRNPGTYTMITTVSGDEASNTIKINAKTVDKYIINAKDLTIVENKDATFTATVKYENGTPAANIKVGFTWKDKTGTQYATSNKNGVVSITINRNVGTYALIMSLDNGYKATSNIYVVANKPVITANDLNMKYNSGSSFTATVKNADGTPASGVKVGFKFKNEDKTYYRTTDANGVASIEINRNPGVYTMISSVENGNSVSNTIKVISASGNGYGYWVFGGDMTKVNLADLAKKGTNNIFLNYYAISANGEKNVINWIKQANSYGINVHIWMQAFYDGAFKSPVLSNGKPDYTLFNQKINEAKYYAGLSGIAGVHLDHLRFPGNAYKYNKGTEAINEFVKRCSEAVRGVNPNIIVSAAVMPETSSNPYYYGQDVKVIGKYLDVIIPMIYKGNYAQPTSWITTTTKWFVDNTPHAEIWAGIQGYKSDSDTTVLLPSQLVNDANAALKGSATGVVDFRFGVTNLLDFNSLIVDPKPDVPSGTTFTKSEIQQGAKYLKEYIESNGVLPTSITMGKKVCSVPQFLYLMAAYTANYNTQSQFALINVTGPSSTSGDEMNKKFNDDDYTKTAKELADYITTNKKAPGDMDTAIGKIKYSSLLYAYAKIINFVIGYGQLPTYVYVTNVVDNYALTVVMYPSVQTSEYKYIPYRATWLNYCPKCNYYGTLLDNPKHTHEGELTCAYCDSDYCGVTGKNKLASSSIYLTRLTPSVPEGSVDPGKGVSLSDIIAASKVVKGYYEANGVIPDEVTMGYGKVSSAQFLYLLSKAIVNLGASNKSDITIIDVADPEGPFGDSISAQLNQANYTELAGRLAAYIEKNGQAPNYATSDVGKIIYDELVDAFSRIVNYYGVNKAMPLTVAIKWGSGGGGDIPTSISDLAKTLTKGLSTATAKATALYNYVRDNIAYEMYYDTVKGAEGTLVSKGGNCCDQAQLLVAMGRAVNLTCRFEHGTCSFSSGLYTGHVWVQFQIDGKWINADPTSSRNSFGVIKNWNTASYTHHGYYDVLPF